MPSGPTRDRGGSDQGSADVFHAAIPWVMPPTSRASCRWSRPRAMPSRPRDLEPAALDECHRTRRSPMSRADDDAKASMRAASPTSRGRTARRRPEPRRGPRIAVEPLADQAGEVAGHAVDTHGAEVDQARDPIALEEEVLRPGVAEARLERDTRPAASRSGSRSRGDRPGQPEPSQGHRAGLVRGRPARDGPLERVEAAPEQVRDRRGRCPRPGEVPIRRSPPRRRWNAASAANADRTRAGAGGRATSAAPGIQGASSQNPPSGSWSVRPDRSAIGAGIKPRSPARRSQRWTCSRCARPGPWGGQPRRTSGPRSERNRQSRAPLSPPAPPRASGSSSG